MIPFSKARVPRTPARARDQREAERAVEEALRAGGPLSRALADMPASVDVQLLAEAIGRLDADAALAAVSPADFERAILDVLMRGVEAGSVGHAGRAAESLIERPRVPGRAAAWARERAGTLIREINDEQREAVRAAVARAIRSGAPGGRAARQIQQVVGLTARQEETVARTRAQLEERGLPAARVDAAVARRAGQLRRQRAETIARTEAVGAVARGRAALWDDIVESGAAKGLNVVQIWIMERGPHAATDPCPALDGQEVGRGKPFPGGFVAPPAHTRCRCSVAWEAREP